MHIAGVAPTPATAPARWGLFRPPRTTHRAARGPDCLRAPPPKPTSHPRATNRHPRDLRLPPETRPKILRNFNADIYLQHFNCTLSAEVGRTPGHKKTSGCC